jgi:hypothetical protein
MGNLNSFMSFELLHFFLFSIYTKTAYPGWVRRGEFISKTQYIRDTN